MCLNVFEINLNGMRQQVGEKAVGRERQRKLNDRVTKRKNKRDRPQESARHRDKRQIDRKTER